MATTLQDLRHAVRMMRKSPGFAIIAVLTLAVGVGASTAIFSVIDNLLFRPPRFAHADRLVYIVDTNPEKVPPDVEVPPSPGNVLDWRERSRSFEVVSLWRNWYYSIRETGADSGLAESVRGVRVSPPFFQMLGVDAMIGRTFRDEEGVPGRDQVVILSHRLWVRRFSGDPAIVGRQVLVDGRPRSVVGVLPADFQFLQPDLELWLPFAEDAALRDRQNHSVLVFARLARDVSVAQAQRDLDRITAALAREYPDANTGWGARIIPLYPSREVRDVRPALIVLLAASGFVLLIACVNVANLLLGRAVARQREMVIRTAVGASRGKLIRQVIVESVTLAAAGGVAGVIVASWGVRALVPLLPHVGTNQGMGTFGPIVPALNVRMLAFSVSVALLTGVLFSLVPAFQSTRLDSLRPSGSSTPGRVASRWLLVAELTLAIMLLAGAGLLVKSVWRLQDVHPGFRSDHLLTMQLWVPKTKYPEPADARRFYEQLLGRIQRLPGVRGAGAVSFRPFLGMAMTTRIDVDGRTPKGSDDDVFVGYDVVTPGYLRLMAQPLLKGRDLAESDTEEGEGVAVVNEAMARQLWPNADPIGKHVRPGFSRTDVPWAVDAPARWLTIVGVAADIKEFRLNEQPRPLMYVSYRQFPSSFMYLIVRTDVPPEMLSASIQREINALDPDQPVSNVRTMEQAISEAVPRFDVSAVALFAGLAWLLATIGVYGVTSYGVAQRTREIAIRMALGASPDNMLSLVIRETLAVGALAVVSGVAGALALSRAMVSMLYGVAPTDASALATAAGALLVTVFVAAFVPARRAARVEPVTALKHDDH